MIMDTEADAAPPVPENLTTRLTEDLGPAGHFVELDADAAKAREDDVVVPSSDQLALR